METLLESVLLRIAASDQCVFVALLAAVLCSALLGFARPLLAFTCARQPCCVSDRV